MRVVGKKVKLEMSSSKKANVKWKRMACAILICLGVLTRLFAQQSDTDRKLFEENKAKAEKGDAKAQFVVGLDYSQGNGVTQSSSDAFRWFSKAADQGFVKAQASLGYCYLYGNGVDQDYAEAMNWLRKAADQGDASAQVNLGLIYADKGTPEDCVESEKLLRKAADQGSYIAQWNLGCAYAKGCGVSQDYIQAIKWFRKAADQNFADAQSMVGYYYLNGYGVETNYAESMKWFLKAAAQDYAIAQANVGGFYLKGDGVAKDYAEALKWYRKAAAQNLDSAELVLGSCYSLGEGVVKDEVEAAKWYRKAAEQGYAGAQCILGGVYYTGDGVAKDYVEGYKWLLLAAGQGNIAAKKDMPMYENLMAREQISEGQKLARNFKPREVPSAGGAVSAKSIAQTRPESSGTGFFITEDGFLVSNEHVVRDATQVRLVTSGGLINAKVVKVDAANDLALLKADGRFTPLPVVASRAMKLGGTVATVGFPNIGLQGFAPKFARGEIASLSGASDDARYFQISVPLQPGNSGGALVDEHGNVIGIVSAKLDAAIALAASGVLPENVNYAVKSSFLLSFLESEPAVINNLKTPVDADRRFDDVVKAVQNATVLVLVY